MTLFERYLNLLSISRREPSLEALTEVVAAHLYRVPFENVSKVYYKKHLGLKGRPSLEQFLDGIERHHFGGTCYTNNGYLNRLLNDLGYDAILCGADMNAPDVHLVNIVRIDGREYLVDVGYAAPFDHPLPRDLAVDYIITRGRNQYVLKPQDAAGRSRLEQLRDGQQKHGYQAKPEPRKIEEFQPVILRSFRSEATFMNSLLVARFFPGRSLIVHNLTITDSVDEDSTSVDLPDTDALIAIITGQFGMASDVVRDVIGELGDLHGDPWT